MVAKKDFSDRMLRALKPAEPGKRYVRWDAAVPGFGIRVTERSAPDRIGTFVLVARYPGSDNPAPRAIGEFPGMSLADARDVARSWREMIRGGIDPKAKAERERQKVEQDRRAAEERESNTFKALFDTYADKKLSKLRTGKSVAQTIRKHVESKWGSWLITDIRRRHVIDLVEELADDTPINANRVLAHLKTFFRWCVDRDCLEDSPAQSVRRPSRETRRDRVLTDAELRAFWKASGSMGVYGRAFRFMLVTGQRRTEVGEARWSEIDAKAKTWTLPQERTKASRSHEVPLSDLAREILDACHRLDRCDYVFTTGRTGTKVKDEIRPISGWTKAKTRLDELMASALEEEGLPASEWHLHDLRRTAATNMSKLGADRIVIARVLNHADREVTGVYDRHRYEPEKRRALEAWAQRLLSLESAASEKTEGAVLEVANG